MAFYSAEVPFSDIIFIFSLIVAPVGTKNVTLGNTDRINEILNSGCPRMQEIRPVSRRENDPYRIDRIEEFIDHTVA